MSKTRSEITWFLLWGSFFVLFLFLGRWQWHRYHEKQQLQAHYDLLHAAPARAFLDPGPLPPVALFSHIKIRGRYDNEKTLFLQNQFNQGQVGYDIITPFQRLGDSRWLLINRGFVPGGGKNPPTLQSFHSLLTLSGYVFFTTRYIFTLGPTVMKAPNGALLIQKMDYAALKRATGLDFYPWTVRLDAEAPSGFRREWPLLAVEPQRHLGYAIQWWAMAAVLTMAVFLCKRKRKI